LAIDALAMSDRVDVIVLVSGGGDFRRLVEIVGARGVRVEVMAFGKSTSADLRQVADRYIDIASHADRLRD
ncbi:MAG: NYN domain-containing protein, partial [Rhodococcus sp.]|nr:NYN domain-containing protein [Rhodococcus sp. (in: high G+C Gram-positive bacteria)]